MTRAGKIRNFFLFAAVAAGVVFAASRLVEVSGEKSSRRSEYAVLDHILERQADAGDSELVKDFNEQVIRELHRHFHHLPDVKEIDPAHQSQCLMCHSLLPHSKNEKIRVMLNMHSDFLNCETCHYQKQQEDVAHTWFNMGIDDETTRGARFGTHYDEETGLLEGTNNHISKITPVLNGGDKEEILFMSQSHPMALDYIGVKDRLTPGQREQAKKKFHGKIEDKGWDCRECHKPQGVLDLQALGFSERRAREIENLEIVGMFDKYEVFYLPKW
jgi:hypothetical protein